MGNVTRVNQSAPLFRYYRVNWTIFFYTFVTRTKTTVFKAIILIFVVVFAAAPPSLTRRRITRTLPYLHKRKYMRTYIIKLYSCFSTQIITKRWDDGRESGAAQVKYIGTLFEPCPRAPRRTRVVKFFKGRCSSVGSLRVHTAICRM